MKRFFDTNVLLYRYDKSAPLKREIAAQLIDDAIDADAFVISTQVMSEFFSISTGKFAHRMTIDEAHALLTLWSELDIVSLTPEMILEAVELRSRHQLSWWDALIVVAALRAGADVIYSEDFSHLRRIDSMRVENPFAHTSREPAPPAYR